MSRFDRAQRRREQREQSRSGGHTHTTDCPATLVEGMVLVNEHDLGPGRFAVDQFDHGVVLMFEAPTGRVEILLTPESGHRVGRVLDLVSTEFDRAAVADMN